jgi:putative tryptophan/tyrosine transport system ATP-binding protein
MLALTGLVKRFGAGTAAEVTALDGVSLEVRAGEFVTLIGSNGAGKSTLLRAILGTIVPERGGVSLDGRDVTREPVHRRARHIGRIAQDPAESTCAGMTVEENLAMAARRGQSRGLGWAVTAPRRETFRARLAEVGLGLEGRLGTRVGTLSGGQRQGLGLLMATLSTPKVLLLDEHTASLDPKAADLVMAFTGRLVADARLTTLMVTHNMHQAIRWGSRLVMLHAGRVVLDLGGDAKEHLRVQDLVTKFYEASGTELTEDRLLLTR